MLTAVERAEEAVGKGKPIPMITVAKRCFVAIGTIRVRCSVEIDTGKLKTLCDRLVQLDPQYTSFVQMVEDCVRMHGPRK